MSRICVITGAGRGIGHATALRFAARGDTVVAAARSKDELAARWSAQIAALRKQPCVVVPTDVAARDQVRALIETAVARCGRIDVLVNNAGVAPLAPLDELSPEDYDRALRVNCDAVYFATRSVWPIMRRQGGGVIVNLSSMAAFDPFRGFAVYGATKAWVNLFTRAAADEGAEFGIRVYAVAPGAVETGMLRQHFPDFPAERTLQPEDIAAVIEDAARADTSHKTGETIVVPNR